MLYERIKLEDDEKILRTVRRHWWIIGSRSAFSLFLIILPLILLLILKNLELGTVGDKMYKVITDTYQNHFMFLYGAWILINWMGVANFWTDHYLDHWTITSRRIISIDQRGFFHRFLSSFRLERLQDMNIEVKGIIPTLLNFGTIEAQTAGGSNEEFKTDNMPDPRGLKALIIHAADERQREYEPNGLNNDGLT